MSHEQSHIDDLDVQDFYNEEVLNVAIDYVKSLAASDSLVTK